MAAPMRTFLLNRQIAIEARRIAHDHTATCKFTPKDSNLLGDFEDEHTKRCNALKREIEKLALQIKLAGLQAPRKRSEGSEEMRSAADSDPLLAARSDSRSSPEDGRANAGDRLASEPSESATESAGQRAGGKS
jgi:hypothetical protein